ncbi:hypothetical protein ADEAN_000579900 [Angomonas deanei]|uniref:Uncharacterized protein n=1 Tax=Angomonas deanei TaxID=59799 RepID=A0A7G2CH67_9TRYP|nr:hypothetical protein ADEAN_000579900 [Angomonas deanei]
MNGSSSSYQILLKTMDENELHTFLSELERLEDQTRQRSHHLQQLRDRKRHITQSMEELNREYHTVMERSRRRELSWIRLVRRREAQVSYLDAFNRKRAAKRESMGTLKKKQSCISLYTRSKAMLEKEQSLFLSRAVALCPKGKPFFVTKVRLTHFLQQETVLSTVTPLVKKWKRVWGALQSKSLSYALPTHPSPLTVEDCAFLNILQECLETQLC